MSDRVTPVFRRLNKTPLRDLVRGRITGRLDWKSRVAESGLPTVAADFITRMVKRTRLFRLEKAAVADELIAHFLEGLTAGSSPADLVQRFGDERVAARLIREKTTCLATEGLPAVAAELIARVVRRTRLFRMEKAAVAEELVAHFLDGLAAGSSAAELIEKFGDERVAARLIRRAKRRGRALPWRIGSAGIRAMAALLGIYAILLLRFCLSRPTPAIDYVAAVNQPIVQTAPGDRAWPIWRQAILASTDGMINGQRSFSDAVIPPETGTPWPKTVNWLDQHASAIEAARLAAGKPALGFILGPGGSQDDPEMFASVEVRQDDYRGFPWTLLPHLFDLNDMAHVLSLDARRAAEKGDGATAEADITSLLGLARQLRNADGFVVTQEVALQVDDMALERLRLILFNYPGALNDDALVRLAHAISGPQVAADLMSIKRERYFFADIMQRLFTDDGHGDGHLTLSGLRSLNMMIAPMANRDDANRPGLAFEAASTVPMLTASRAELIAEYDRLMDQQEADMHLPIRQIDIHKIESELDALKKSPVDRIRYAILLEAMPAFTVQPSCEGYLGKRDGTVVGIALELYRRRHGKCPAALSELTPELLPAIPADRITGDPVKYRLINGKPVVYSVGADRIDDGGRPPDHAEQYFRSPAAAWGVAPAHADRGDWVLFAADPPEDAGS